MSSEHLTQGAIHVYLAQAVLWSIEYFVRITKPIIQNRSVFIKLLHQMCCPYE